MCFAEPIFADSITAVTTSCRDTLTAPTVPLPNSNPSVEMREELRGTWLARDRERAEANRIYVRANADKIPADVRDQVLAAIEFAEHTEQWDDVLVDGWTKDTQRHIGEINSLKAEIKGLIGAIRAATSKKPLVAWPRRRWKECPPIFFT